MNKRLIAKISTLQPQMKQWMDTMHRRPELSMQEFDTARYIAEVVKSFGAYELAEGVGKNGMV